MLRLSEVRKKLAIYVSEPIARLLAKTPVTPNTLTWIGFLITIGAAVLIFTGHLLAAGAVVLFAGIFDMLDGALARYTGRVSHFGAVLDSVLDRLSEAVLLFGILVWHLSSGGESIALVVLIFLTLLGSPLVSYLRARAEALGLECQLGIFTRTERVIVLALGLVLSQIDYALIIALAIIVVFSFITAAQRLVYIWQQTRTG